MRSVNNWNTIGNGHKRRYLFEYLSEYPSLPAMHSMFFVDDGRSISVYTAAGSVDLDRAQLAKLLKSARNNERMTLVGYYDHLYCGCPKQVTTSRDNGYQQQWYAKFSITKEESDRRFRLAQQREQEKIHA